MRMQLGAAPAADVVQQLLLIQDGPADSSLQFAGNCTPGLVPRIERTLSASSVWLALLAGYSQTELSASCTCC